MSELSPSTHQTKHKKQDWLPTDVKTRPLLDLNRTVAGSLFLYRTRPWDAIPGLSKYITERGIDLPYDEYDEIAENIWVHITAYIAPTAKIEGPAIICGGAKLCHHSHVASSVIGSFSLVGEGSYTKSSILFDRSKLCGHNELLSSILGYESVFGIGAMAPDERLDALNITVNMPEGIYITGRSHLGSVICDGTKVASGAVLNPGSVLDGGCVVYPLASVTGYHRPYSKIH